VRARDVTIVAMRPLLAAALLVAACSSSPDATPPAPTAAAPAPTPTTEASAVKDSNLYGMSAAALGGGDVDLAKYRGKVALVVNVASECGFTPQYAGLEKLWREYEGKGLVVLGFPSNEFGGQEPGDAAAIQAFCTKNYGVTFPLFAKVETKKGAGQSPVYAYLTGATGQQPNWNFCKYLVGKNGDVIRFWQSKTTPESAELRGAIDAALAAK
jgi:glutathione peroxidase